MNIKSLIIIPIVALLLGVGVWALQAPRGVEVGEPQKPAASSTPPVTPTPTSSVQTGNSITLREGQTATFSDGLTVKLAEITDSRCPKDVQCVWAGELGARLIVTHGAVGVTPTEVTLGEVTSKSASVKGYTLSLTGITETSVTIVVKSASGGSVSTGLRGYIHLGPTCPVERDPPDPKCGDKPFSNANVSIRDKANGALIKSVVSDASGNFFFALAPGTYTITAQSEANSPLPRCESQEATVVASALASVDISCDSGIR